MGCRSRVMHTPKAGMLASNVNRGWHPRSLNYARRRHVDDTYAGSSCFSHPAALGRLVHSGPHRARASHKKPKLSLGFTNGAERLNIFRRGPGKRSTVVPLAATGAQEIQPGPEPQPEADGGAFERRLGVLASGVASFYPLWLALVSGAGLMHPPLLAWFQEKYVSPCLALTMLAMGTSLTLDDFAAVARQPGLLLTGALMQYTIMPLLGFAISRVWGLSPGFSVGICLVSCCPGGVASNLVSYLAHADVPLSVAMTAISTIAAVVATPALTGALVGALVPVDGAGLLVSTLQVVLAPVLLGSYLNQAAPAAVRRAAPFAPLLAVSMTVLVSASVIASRAAAIKQAGWSLVAALATLHAGGFALGYGASRVLGIGERQARTISIEVGMQNSALGAVLALQHFPSMPLAAVPCAISACMHSLLGSALAGAWRANPPAPVPAPAEKQ